MERRSKEYEMTDKFGEASASKDVLRNREYQWEAACRLNNFAPSILMSLSVVMSKKGQPPRVLGIHLPGPTAVEVFPNVDGAGISVGVANASDESRWIQSLRIANEYIEYLWLQSRCGPLPLWSKQSLLYST
jgi:hypothetical protein